MSCPNFETLNSPDNHEHFTSCDACRALLQLRSLERPTPQQCQEVEGLFGIYEELTLTDRESIDKHLASCPACTIAAYNTIADFPNHSAFTPWKGPTMDAVITPSSIPTPYAIAGGLVFAALAVVLTLAVKSSGEDTPSIAIAPVGESETPGIPTKAGANRPSVDRAQHSMNSNPSSTWEERGKAASASGDYDRQLSLCSTALVADPSSQEAAYLCALAFGGSESVSGRFLNTIDDEALQARASQVMVEQYKRSCDEITCLVEPAKACCALFSKDKFTLVTEELMEKAVPLVRNKKYTESMVFTEMALLIDPKHEESLQVAAVALCNLGQFEKGYSYIERIPKSASTSALTQICSRLGGTPPGENK